MKKLLILFYIVFSIPIFSQPWQLQNIDLPAEAVACPFSPVDENICWASWTTGNTSTSEFINGYLRTTDGGQSWICDTIPEMENGIIYWIDAIDANTAYITVESWADWGMQGIYKTTDGGANWIKDTLTYSNSAWGPGYIHFFDSDNGVVLGEVDPNTSCFEIYTTTNAGVDWNAVPAANIPPSTVTEYLYPFETAEKGNIIYFPTVSVNGPRLLKTTDMGYTWTATSIPGTNQNHVMFPAFENQTTGMRLLWDFNHAADPVIERTTDGGENWTTMPGPYGDCIPVTISYVPGTESGYVITGDVNVNGYAGGSAYTLDGGNTWRNIDNGNYCGTIFYSDQVGWASNWNTNNFYKYVGPPMPLPVELSSFTASVSGNEVNLKWSTATETNNNGFEVQRKLSGARDQEWTTVGFVKGKGTTTEKQQYSFINKNVPSGNYIYRLKQTDFNGSSGYSDEVMVNVKSVYTYFLGQNYPNPFNPTTTIKFGIKEKSNVRIDLFNSIGQRVNTILNEEREAGNYTIDFNASDLPSGVYLYQINSGKFSSIRKMILMK